ncbi:MAG: nucleoside triphosphate pyrophosphohydrolase [Kiritimatiellae bacterium]|nr:nucleoside triphosphate pyrophosphohydrolase [Kiritimatiellia bacterium]
MREQSLARLLEIMEILRSEQGCPWDREQTLESLKSPLVEETYEVLDAIDGGDRQALKDELGDLLLQVVFQAQLCREEDSFDFYDVAQAICDKLIRRHPHIFAEAEAVTSQDVIRHWEAIKQVERGGARRSVLAGVPRSMPPMPRAYQLQRKAARVGFDWPDVRGVADKVAEELREVEDALARDHAEDLREELGDLLFSVINLCRFAGCDAEEMLKGANKKFERRFQRVEQSVEAEGRVLPDCSAEELDRLWNEAKRAEKG